MRYPHHAPRQKGVTPASLRHASRGRSFRARPPAGHSPTQRRPQPHPHQRRVQLLRQRHQLPRRLRRPRPRRRITLPRQRRHQLREQTRPPDPPPSGNARRCRGSNPYAASPATARAMINASASYHPGGSDTSTPSRSNSPSVDSSIPLRATRSARPSRTCGDSTGSSADPARHLTVRTHRHQRRPLPTRRSPDRVPLRQLLTDHPQRQILVPLRGQHEPQPRHIVPAVLPVTRRRPLRLHQTLGLQEPQLRDRRRPGNSTRS